MGFIKKRTKAKILRFRNYSLELDPMNYYRERIMLFLPWRNEAHDILDKDIHQVYSDNSQIITANSKQYNKLTSDLDVDLLIDSEDDEEEGYLTDEKFRAYGIQDIEQDISIEFPELLNDPISNVKKATTILSDMSYITLIRSLNEKQQNYLSHAMHKIKKTEKIYEFVGDKFNFSNI